MRGGHGPPLIVLGTGNEALPLRTRCVTTERVFVWCLTSA